MAQVARRLAIGGRAPHVSTIWRWIHLGFEGIRLEHVKIGRRIGVPESALERFRAEMTELHRAQAAARAAAPQPARRQAGKPSTRASTEGAERARQQLREGGVLP